MKKRLVAPIVRVLAILCMRCTPDQYEPEDGVWYCEELQIQLSYEPGAQCFVIIDGETIICACGSDRGVNRIELSAQHPDHPDYVMGELIYSAEIISLHDNELVVYDEVAETQYMFTRIS